MNNLDRSGNGYKNASGYYMMDKNDEPMYPDKWRPPGVKWYTKKDDNNLEELFT